MGLWPFWQPALYYIILYYIILYYIILYYIIFICYFFYFREIKMLACWLACLFITLLAVIVFKTNADGISGNGL